MISSEPHSQTPSGARIPPSNHMTGGPLTLTKADRKRMRKQYRALAAKDEYEEPPSATQEKLPPRWSRDFLELHLKTALDSFWVATSLEMNPDFSPESLTQLDLNLPENLSEEIRCRGHEPASSIMWAFHAGLGSYFGEVLVRTHRGAWRYPGRLVVLLAWLLNRPDILYRHWYVVVGRQRVPVFEIARRRETLGRERASLAKAFEEIAKPIRGE